MTKFFPILADPNAPSSFTGIDLTLADGQITALDSSLNSFLMTPSTLTANGGYSATWVDIITGATSATPDLQLVLEAGASAVNQSVTLNSEGPNVGSSVLAPSSFSMNDADVNSFTMNSVSLSFLTTESPSSVLSSYDIQFNDVAGGASASMSSAEVTYTSATGVNHITASYVDISDENGANLQRTIVRKDKVQVADTEGGLKVSYMDATSMNISQGADGVVMTASTVTANNDTSATWVNIIDVANNPPPTPSLQLVLDTGNSANGADASISLLGGVDDLVTASLNNAQLVLTDAPHSSTLTALEHSFAGVTASATLSEASLAMVDTDVSASLSASSLTMNFDGSTSVVGASSVTITLDATPTTNVSLGLDELVYSSVFPLTGAVSSTLTPSYQNFATTTDGAYYRATGVSITGADSTGSSFSAQSLTIDNATSNATLSPASLALTVDADTATMTATTLTANASSATWADIIAVANAPPADAPTLQSVLNESNSAIDQSINLSETTSDFTTSMSAVSFSATLGSTNTAGFNAESFSMNDLAGGFFSTIYPASFTASDGGSNATAVMSNNELTVSNSGLGKTMVVSSGSVTATNTTNDDVNVMSPASVSITNLSAGVTSTSVLSGPSLSLTKAEGGSSVNTMVVNTESVTATDLNNDDVIVMSPASVSLTNLSAGITSTSVLSGPSISLTKAESGSVDVTAVLVPVSLTMTNDFENTVLNSSSLTLNYNPPSGGIPSVVSVGSEFITATKQTYIGDLSPERLQFTNDTFPDSLGLMSYSGATFNSASASVVLDGSVGSVVATSGTDVNTFSPTQLSVESASASSVLSPASLVLASATDSLTISPSLSASAGGSTDQYLVITINGTAYRISLLAPPAP